jgi:hypothetical protein
MQTELKSSQKKNKEKKQKAHTKEDKQRETQWNNTEHL